MNILIVESNPDLGLLWQSHVERLGMSVTRTESQSGAAQAIQTEHFDLIVLNLLLEDGSAFAVADFASYRQPQCKVIFVSRSSFFSDGSIFNLCANACAFLPAGTAPEDLAAMAEHYASEPGGTR
ncbi:Response regulator receiver domain-containing protein [Roseivivax lentus]|uniref:Response regulator receiver domain-containing protein n=1 Tax=Roseivivax lentus TaxID=633194 RepID=A0A1N7MEM2_9RHOB|nr:response regulator [Roseivivax lentus]SIS84534.1 Response regulator receiver domain-containing protein [Roseivivax lentus]